MSDKQLTIEQISAVFDKALKPVNTRLTGIESDVKEIKERVGGIEERVGGLEADAADLKEGMANIQERLESQEELMQEMKIDLDVIKEDYIGQLEEIRSHVGMSPLIKHKSV